MRLPANTVRPPAPPGGETPPVGGSVSDRVQRLRSYDRQSGTYPGNDDLRHRRPR